VAGFYEEGNELSKFDIVSNSQLFKEHTISWGYFSDSSVA